MAGTCEVPMPATILATIATLRLAAVALDGAAALEHHFRILLLRGAGHFRGDLLERQAVRRTELCREIDVAAELEHAVPLTLQNGFALFGRELEFVEIGGLVGLEGFT